MYIHTPPAATSTPSVASPRAVDPPPPSGPAAADPPGPTAVGVGPAPAVGCAVDGTDPSGGTSAVSAATRSITPWPYWSSRPGGPLSTAVAVNRCTTSLAGSDGYFARINATAPATIAVASDVPVPLRYFPPDEVL
ncbi:hypothetical protein AWW66_19980 [Micromonospora rosaria]|uniref:Uncharacterized protein n=1 Tax=Micromonospora rosaria TaxID=47874 RepID=A0A136PPB4_9ACTN|nr:hypothetical protein AWW66_19980 [Micromonospora rosaria]